jgi:predicted transcriptional regulator
VAREDAPGRPRQLADLRRSGSATALLFLYECTTEERGTLQPIADRLGLTVQAASHIFRQLRRAGLVELRAGVYRPTVAGVAWLHGALGSLQQDLAERLARLRVFRRARALAESAISDGAAVSLEMKGGWLVARPGSAGPSRGRAVGSARAGELLDVVELDGILPIAPGRIRVLSVPQTELDLAATADLLRTRLEDGSSGLVGAVGLDAWHLLRALGHSSVERFGVGAASLEASQLGVDSTVVLVETELPRFLSEFAGAPPSNLVVERLSPARPRRPAGRSGARAATPRRGSRGR